MLDSEIECHAARVLAKYESLLVSDRRFINASRLVDRFREVYSQPPNDLAGLRKLHESHNELAVAEALLREPLLQLTYEPLEDGQNKTIDFLARTADGRDVLVDVKTITPEPRDRWDQYERGRSAGWIPDHFDLSPDSMGGELLHFMFTARARMLEYTVALEAKLPRYQSSLPSAFVVLTFCGNGFSWKMHELEDFAAHYFSGRHRSDDSFATMERHEIEKQGISFTRAIRRFAYLERSPKELEPRICCWNVQAHGDPAAG